MKPKLTSPQVKGGRLAVRILVVCLGAFLGLAMLKFGNPPIMESWVTAPSNVYELLLGSPWPISWAYLLLAFIAVVGVFVASWKTEVPRWLILLPLFWFLWECAATAKTNNMSLSAPVLAHFGACLVCFYLGLFACYDFRIGRLALPGLLIALLIVVAVGWEQHFGGLEQTRRYFYLYLYPRMKEVPPEYLKKLSSNRIFSTLFYPNSLAGAILLLLPGLLCFLWQARGKFTNAARAFLVGGVALVALACLYWSGSKAGWLLMLVLGLLGLLRQRFNRRHKSILIWCLAMLGLAGFFWRYSDFFKRGATSVSARFDYWSAAVRTASKLPVFGTGPGTFALAYAKIKRPESEMARLVHNDYLEQASDSGWPAFLLYTSFIILALIKSFPPVPSCGAVNPPADRAPPVQGYGEVLNDESNLKFAIWLGLLGFALQGFVEFNLYIPALSWTFFVFLGLLLRNRKGPASVKKVDN